MIFEHTTVKVTDRICTKKEKDGNMPMETWTIVSQDYVLPWCNDNNNYSGKTVQ